MLEALTRTALAVFHAKSSGSIKPPEWLGWFSPMDDPVLRQIDEVCFVPPDAVPAMDQFVNEVLDTEEFSFLSPRSDSMGPMVVHPWGGSRTSSHSIVSSIFSNAFRRMAFLGEDWTESNYVRNVLDAFEDLRRALRGEAIQVLSVQAVGNIELRKDTLIRTPWGTLRPSPATEPQVMMHHLVVPETRCFLTNLTPLPVRLDWANQPKHDFAEGEHELPSSTPLLRIACALASHDDSSPAVPVFKWSTYVLPFGQGSGYGMQIQQYGREAVVDVSDIASSVEEWGRVVNRKHVGSLSIAANRLASAVAHRTDKADALVDAVMVWENILGPRSEVQFRVTAALAILLEKEPTARRALRRELSKIYDIRSRIVHGDTIDSRKISDTSSRAVEISLRALRAAYKMNDQWLGASSSERSEALLLGAREGEE